MERPSLSEERERMLDQTLADSFPASDPPSSLPNPEPASDERPGERAAQARFA
jgi:hypothetical protein